MSSEMLERPPWDATMEDETERNGRGEGTPPGSGGWTVIDWDNFNFNTLIHSHIMVLYQLITYTRIAVDHLDRELSDDVIALLLATIDNLGEMRDTIRDRRLF